MEADPAVVIFSIDPRMKDAQAMVDAVRAHLTGLPVRLATEAPGLELPPPGHLLGTLSIDPTTPSEWIVSFTEPAIDTTLVRHIRLKPQGKVVALEEVAIVVRSMIEAILDGGHVGIVKAASHEAEPNPSTPKARTLRRGLAATGGYAGSMFAHELGWQSGGMVGLRWQMGEFYFGPTYAGYLQMTADGSPLAAILLLRHPTSIVFGYEGSKRVAFSAQLELTADYVQRYRSYARDDFVETPDQPRWSFLAGGQVGVAWSFLPRVRLMGHGGIDWMINRYSYYVTDPDGNIGNVVTPMVVRPKLDVLLAIDFW